MCASSTNDREQARLEIRLGQLFAGLVLYGLSVALMVEAGLGLNPWDVLHQGLSERLDISIGVVSIGVSIAVLVLWIPIRQRPGFGTLCNVIVVGVSTDIFLALLAEPTTAPMRALWLAGGVTLNAIATVAYIGANLGPGPRDGLMTGLVSRMHWPLGPTRMGVELTVLVMGWLLGGAVGLGTAVYAIFIGPLVHLLMRFFATRAVG